MAKSDVNLKVDRCAIVDLRLDWLDALGSSFDLSLYIDNATDEE